MLDRTRHEIILKKILADIYSNKRLQNKLAFKDGTCLYLFHKLNRFSTDLDFNLLNNELKSYELTKILKQYLILEENISKRNTWFWLGSFEKGRQKVKVEVSKRRYLDKYETKNFYGFTVKTMTKDCMFAHKLCAITDRRKPQNRDLFDALFMFEQGFNISEEIIKQRTGKNLKEYFKELIDFIEKKINPALILDGLGEVLDEKQKVDTKKNLINKLLFELKIRSE
ncbi:MAG: hypothetical protein GF347_04195 [Candidatus Moranbacteria bacterium]|nr:hypothetical protein [Candidatus Moranbacteria bacterium]